jgi:hypothetical protein
MTDQTDEFNMIWQNDQDVYMTTLAFAQRLLLAQPGMTDQTLGLNVKHRVFSWAYGGGWGYSSGWGGATTSLRDVDRYPDWTEGGPPPGWRNGPFNYFLERDARVSEEGVAEQVRDALQIEEVK